MTLHRPNSVDRAAGPTMTPLQRLTALGTSVWLDGLAPPDELHRLVHAAGVTGLTSNPTIFRAAVLGSGGHAARISALAGRPPAEIYETLAIEDVRAAADVLAPIYDRTEGADGFVSVEVDPALADDADGTLAAARDLWARIDRPNAMIKIPATGAGVEATRRAIADGINVNVTLLFSVEGYAAVVDAYLGGLEERLRRGDPVHAIASVASFFVSRVDSAVDPMLAAAGRDDLLGRVSVANARLAYAHASGVFAGPRFAVLRAAGARPQRPLWASTGTKDARYSDVKYVDELAGPGVINTMPPATLSAYADHGAPADRLTATEPAARAVLDGLARSGIDLDAVTDDLLADGVARFAGSMDELRSGVSAAAGARAA
jgi:transaldolase